mmetsp:Transcript_48749/g.80893  ORF Transcript_48749/g.80893 Transcript_48749/m.80893 type:complete len:223 (+) Transcript_48749:412-1080(+)
MQRHRIFFSGIKINKSIQHFLLHKQMLQNSSSKYHGQMDESAKVAQEYIVVLVNKRHLDEIVPEPHRNLAQHIATFKLCKICRNRQQLETMQSNLAKRFLNHRIRQWNKLIIRLIIHHQIRQFRDIRMQSLQAFIKQREQDIGRRLQFGETRFRRQQLRRIHNRRSTTNIHKLNQNLSAKRAMPRSAFLLHVQNTANKRVHNTRLMPFKQRRHFRNGRGTRH